MKLPILLLTFTFAVAAHVLPSQAEPTPTTQPAASRLGQVKLVAGMKRVEAEQLIAQATGIPSKYDLNAMDTSREVAYRDGAVTLIVQYKPGSPSPLVQVPEGGAQHLPPIDGEVIAWRFEKDGAPSTRPVNRPATARRPLVYRDGRPAAELRLNAEDHGIVLRHGDGPERCDLYGARDVWVYEANGVYFMHYDAAGPKGWLAALATSKDLVHWEKKGPVLDLGKPGENDSASASYGVTHFDGKAWHMYYLGTPNVTPAPDRVPGFPYLTMKARSTSPAGPWAKQPDVTPFRCKPGTYYSVTASPGHIIKQGDTYRMLFSAATDRPIRRTIGIARTKDLDGPWTLDREPILPATEQIENSSLYFEEASKTWFLFTNHVGLDAFEYTDAVWVYWSKDLDRWDPSNKAVVLDGSNSSWSKHIIGLPSVVKVGDRLALFYDGNAEAKMPGGIKSHMNRDIGLAWLKLPLVPPG